MSNIEQDINNNVNNINVRRLKKVAFKLSSKPEAKNIFFKNNGVSKILPYLKSKNSEIVKLVYCALAFSAVDHHGNQRTLTTEPIFKILSEELENSGLTYQTSYAIFLISIILKNNRLGQLLIRETGCLHQLLTLFHNVIQHVGIQRKKEDKKNVMKVWNVLCKAIKLSANDPLNIQNQQEAGVVIPAGNLFINLWIMNAYKNEELITGLKDLLGMMTYIVGGSDINQSLFAKYSGIVMIIRHLKTLISWQDSLGVDLHQVKCELVLLMDAAIFGNTANSTLTASKNGVSILVKMLHTKDNKLKHNLLVTLTHLIETCEMNKAEFRNKNGFATVAFAISGTDSNVNKAAKCLFNLYKMDVINKHLMEDYSIHVSQDMWNQELPMIELYSEKCDMEAKQFLQTSPVNNCEVLNTSASTGTYGNLRQITGVMINSNDSSNRSFTQNVTPCGTSESELTIQNEKCKLKDNKARNTYQLPSVLQTPINVIKKNWLNIFSSNTIKSSMSRSSINRKYMNCNSENNSNFSNISNTKKYRCHPYLPKKLGMIPANSGVPYTQLEITNLVLGVKNYGMNFEAIRETYNFHALRTAEDLYTKWKECFIHH